MKQARTKHWSKDSFTSFNAFAHVHPFCTVLKIKPRQLSLDLPIRFSYDLLNYIATDSVSIWLLPLPMIHAFFFALTIVTLDLLWSSLALHITTTTQHSFLEHHAPSQHTNESRRMLYLTYDQLPRLASYAVYSHLSYICNRWHGRETQKLILP